MKNWLGFLVCVGLLNYRLAMIFCPIKPVSYKTMRNGK